MTGAKLILLLLGVAICVTPAYAAKHRSGAAKNAFKRDNPCPANGNTKGSCPGYVIDHIVPLACGGPDDKSNMQWQSVHDGKIKDRFELGMCGR